MVTLALFVLLAAAEKPKVELKPSPQMAMLGVGPRSSATVRFRLSIKDAGNEDFYCPKVEWEWEGHNQHNVTVTRGPVKFHSKTMSSGSFSKRLTRKGTYTIYCTIHSPKMRMTSSGPTCSHQLTSSTRELSR